MTHEQFLKEQLEELEGKRNRLMIEKRVAISEFDARINELGAIIPGIRIQLRNEEERGD